MGIFLVYIIIYHIKVNIINVGFPLGGECLGYKNDIRVQSKIPRINYSTIFSCFSENIYSSLPLLKDGKECAHIYLYVY